MCSIKIAIDGPAGAGKSSIARLLAEKMGFLYIDTGAMYRALTLIAIEENIDPNDAEALARRLHELDIRLELGRTYIGERDVSQEIRTRDVDSLVSIVCAHPAVRREMVARQRNMARNGGIVMEGRDIGTVVLPDAELKIFLTASVPVRAKRRAKQLEEVGITPDLKTLENEIERRDKIDSTRADSPLKIAQDAVLVDNSDETKDETLNRIIGLVEEYQKIKQN